MFVTENKFASAVHNRDNADWVCRIILKLIFVLIVQSLHLPSNFRLIVNTFIYETKTSEDVTFHHKASYLDKETAALETVLSYILLKSIL